MSTVKKTTSSKSLSSQEIEIEISALQEKLSKARDKEHKSTLLLRDRKLAQLSRANTKLKTCRERKAAIILKVKTKKTAASEKQLNNALNALSVANETLAALKIEVREIKLLISRQKFILAKASATTRALSALDKTWVTKDPEQKKTTVVKKKTAVKTTTRPTSKKPASKPEAVKSAVKTRAKAKAASPKPKAPKKLPSKSAKLKLKVKNPPADPQTSMQFSETSSHDTGSTKPPVKNIATDAAEKKAPPVVDTMQSAPGRSIFDPEKDI